jgi:ABC-type nitrate/sulfonate/bicarbonate transport system substrate-binding protein
MSERHQIIAGFMPLLDSALLVAAREKGFAEGEGTAAPTLPAPKMPSTVPCFACG